MWDKQQQGLSLHGLLAPHKQSQPCQQYIKEIPWSINAQLVMAVCFE
jgi:hypothetical protein